MRHLHPHAELGGERAEERVSPNKLRRWYFISGVVGGGEASKVAHSSAWHLLLDYFKASAWRAFRPK